MRVHKTQLVAAVATIMIALIVMVSAPTALGATLSVTATPDIGPPTGTIQVSGSGFPATAAVDIYFDTTDLALAVTNASGAFSGISLQVPGAAVPGTHWISAVVGNEKPTFILVGNAVELGFLWRLEANHPL